MLLLLALLGMLVGCQREGTLSLGEPVGFAPVGQQEVTPAIPPAAPPADSTPAPQLLAATPTVRGSVTGPTISLAEVPFRLAEAFSRGETLAHVVETLRAGGLRLESGNWREEDLSGDGQPEWLLAVIEAPQAMSPVGDVFVLDPTLGEEVAESELVGTMDVALGDLDILVVRDLSGDDLPDVLYEARYCWERECIDYYQLLSYHGATLPSQRLLQEAEVEGSPTRQLIPAAQMTSSTWALQDRTGDGPLELVLHGEVWSGPRLQRGHTQVYGWDGEHLSLIHSPLDPTNLRYFYLKDGEMALSKGEYEQALRLFEEAATNPDLLPRFPREYDSVEEGPDLLRYAYFRLVFTALLAGQPDQAEHFLREMALRWPDHPFTAATALFRLRHTLTGDAAVACADLEAFAQNVPHLTGHLGSWDYAAPPLDARSFCAPLATAPPTEGSLP